MTIGRVQFFKINTDTFLISIFLLILAVYEFPLIAPVLIFLFLLIAYFRLLTKNDFTTIIILILMARCVMGPFLPGNKIAFNILNILCNYLPITIFLFKNINKAFFIKTAKINNLKWTILYSISLLVLSLVSIKISTPVFAREVLPLLLFLAVVLPNNKLNIDFNYLLKFFRYSFIASLLVYFLPTYANSFLHLFQDGVIFKEMVPDVSLYIAGYIPRNAGFMFDFRILSQLSILYFLILFYTKRTMNYWDLLLLISVSFTTFSRGPILILILVLIGAFATKISITSKNMIIGFIGLILIVALSTLAFQNNKIVNYLNSYNPTSKHNAISQRGGFVRYSLNKFKEKPLGRGIGSLSSPNADNRILTGYKTWKNNEPIYYYTVTDAYLFMSLAEKGIVGFVLMVISLFEIFFNRKNYVSLFFTIGLFINLIGTDIPKQGFYYFAILIIYYTLSQVNRKTILNEKRLYEI